MTTETVRADAGAIGTEWSTAVETLLEVVAVELILVNAGMIAALLPGRV